MSAIIKKNSQGYNYKYTDLAETHRYLEESGQSYYQEIDVVEGIDYIVTICLDSSGKEIGRCRGCRVPVVTGKGNPAQEAGCSLTYARRYSLWMAYGLATADDDGAALNTVKPDKKATRKATDKQSCIADPFDRKAGVNAVKRLLDIGDLQLSDVQSEVRKYGVEKMQDLPLDSFVKCVTTLTGRA
jgi:hypothetical protein